jgi:hypothetical protein
VTKSALACTCICEQGCERRPKLNEAIQTLEPITIQDRLDAGNLTIDEVCKLKKRSRSGFYADLKAGLVEIQKQGRRSVVRGPVARRYIEAGR